MRRIFSGFLGVMLAAASTAALAQGKPPLKLGGILDMSGLYADITGPGEETAAKMAVEDIRTVVDLWAAQCQELGARDDISYVQVFENRGAMMGASNPHPHGQIWTSRSLPNEAVAEQAAQAEYLKAHGCCLLCGYREMEVARGERVIARNEHFVTVVPFWAVWPFEVMILPVRHVADLESMNDAERNGLAEMLRSVTGTYDKVFDTPFPYSMGLHPRPYDAPRQGRRCPDHLCRRSRCRHAVHPGRSRVNRYHPHHGYDSRRDGGWHAGAGAFLRSLDVCRGESDQHHAASRYADRFRRADPDPGGRSALEQFGDYRGAVTRLSQRHPGRLRQSESKPYNRVYRKHGLPGPEPVVPGPRAEGILVSKLGTDREQLRESVRHSDRPTG